MNQCHDFGEIGGFHFHYDSSLTSNDSINEKNSINSDQVDHFDFIDDWHKLISNEKKKENPLPFGLENDYELLTQENINLKVENSNLRREVSHLSIKIVNFSFLIL